MGCCDGHVRVTNACLNRSSSLFCPSLSCSNRQPQRPQGSTALQTQDTGGGFVKDPQCQHHIHSGEGSSGLQPDQWKAWLLQGKSQFFLPWATAHFVWIASVLITLIRHAKWQCRQWKYRYLQFLSVAFTLPTSSSSVPRDAGQPERERGCLWHPAVLWSAEWFSGSNKNLGWDNPRIHWFLHRGPGAAPRICLCWALHSATCVQVSFLSFFTIWKKNVTLIIIFLQ